MTHDRPGTLIGRADELSVLGGALADARAGRPRVVFVEGEPGIGKTALLRSFLDEVDGAHCLWASGDEQERALEFGVIDQLWVSIPSGGVAASRRPSATDGLAVGAELLAAIGQLQHHGPVVLAVDDLHWIDAASARALLFVLRRLRHDSVLTLASGHSDAMSRLVGGWARLRADPALVQVVSLTGLSAGEVSTLATTQGRETSPTVSERLREHTGGNPLYLRALFAELPSDQLLRGRAELPAPHSYAVTVLAKLSGLSTAAQDVVVAAAVLGNHAALRTVSAVTGTEHPLDAVEEAARAGLLRVERAEFGDEVHFVHGLMRAAVYDDLPGSRRRALHAAAARVVQPPESLRHRVAATDGADRELSGLLGEMAAQELIDGSLQRAAAYLELRSCVEPDAAVADDSLFRAVELLMIAGQVQECERYAEAVRRRPDGAQRRYAALLLDLSSGELADVADDLTALAGTIAASAEPELYARVAAAIAFLRSVLGADARAADWAQRALAPQQGTVTSDYLAREALAWSWARNGHVDEALTLLTDYEAGVARPDLFVTMLRVARGVIRNWSGDPAAIDDLRAVERRLRSGTPLSDVVFVLGFAALAEAEFRSGRWSDAGQHVELAVSLGEDLLHGWHLPYAHQVATQLYAARGQDRFAAYHADAARQSVDVRHPPAEGLAHAALADAHRAWALGDWEAVAAALRPFEEPSDWTGHPNLAAWRYRLAEARIGQGRAEDALRLLDAAAAVPWSGGIGPADAARLRALALHGPGDDAGARAVFDGMAHAFAGPSTFAEAMLTAAYGQFLLDTGDPGAETPLRAARQVLDRLGAVPARRACDVALGAAATSPAAQLPATPDRLARLTPREQVIARLVAQGATNREAAAELFLSVKGVEYHLGNIFAKLGISSRRQLRPLAIRATSRGDDRP